MTKALQLFKSSKEVARVFRWKEQACKPGSVRQSIRTRWIAWQLHAHARTHTRTHIHYTTLCTHTHTLHTHTHTHTTHTTLNYTHAQIRTNTLHSCTHTYTLYMCAGTHKQKQSLQQPCEHSYCHPVSHYWDACTPQRQRTKILLRQG